MVRKLMQTKTEDPFISLGEILPNLLKRLTPELKTLTGISRLNH